jgi:hypothetical protein
VRDFCGDGSAATPILCGPDIGQVLKAAGLPKPEEVRLRTVNYLRICILPWTGNLTAHLHLQGGYLQDGLWGAFVVVRLLTEYPCYACQQTNLLHGYFRKFQNLHI